MSIWTEEELTQHIALYKQALVDLAQAEQVSLKGMLIRRSQLPEVRKQLQYYETELDKLTGVTGLTIVHLGGVR